jgi:hypothetical protein
MPLTSMVRASPGIVTAPAGPTASIRLPRTTTTAFSIGVPPKPSITRPPESTSTPVAGDSAAWT